MRVIHTVPAISVEETGPSYSVRRLCESLIAEGRDVTLAVLDWTPMASPPRFVKAFPLGLGPRRLGCSPGMRRWLGERARSRSVEIIHNHSLWMMPNVYSGMAAKNNNIALIVSPRGTLSRWALQNGSVVKFLFWPLVQKPAVSAAACFHATSESEYEDIRQMGFRQPVAIIPNGIDAPLSLGKISKGFCTLLFLGRVHPSKGLDMLLPAWQAVQDRFPNWRLVIAGPDNHGYLKTMQDLAKKLLLRRIEFVGSVTGTEKWKAYQDADIFILPTYSENFGMTVAEALASGLPAIVSKGAPWKGLEEKKAGWWIDIGVEPLVDCLNHTLDLDPDALAEIGRRGRTWMQSEYSWEQIGSMMDQTYRWMLQGGDKPDWVRKE